LQSSVVSGCQLAGYEYKEVLVTLVLRPVPGAEAIVIVVGILVLEGAHGIDKPIFEGSIPVRGDILRGLYIDDLFRLTSQQISQLRVWFSCIIKFRVLYFKGIEVVGMPPGSQPDSIRGEKTRLRAGVPRLPRLIQVGGSGTFREKSWTEESIFCNLLESRYRKLRVMVSALRCTRVSPAPPLLPPPPILPKPAQRVLRMESRPGQQQDP